MAKRKRRVSPEVMKELQAKADEATAWMREIHERYTPEVISERLGRNGYHNDHPELKAAVKTEVEQMLADYRQLADHYGIPELYDVALKEVEGLEKALSHLITEATEGQHRRSVL
jgi:DNA-binding protein Fis